MQNFTHTNSKQFVPKNVGVSSKGRANLTPKIIECCRELFVPAGGIDGVCSDLNPFRIPFNFLLQREKPKIKLTVQGSATLGDADC